MAIPVREGSIGGWRVVDNPPGGLAAVQEIVNWLEQIGAARAGDVSQVEYVPGSKAAKFNALNKVVTIGSFHPRKGRTGRLTGVSGAGLLAHEFQHARDFQEKPGRTYLGHLLSEFAFDAKRMSTLNRSKGNRAYARVGPELTANKKLMEVVKLARKSPLIRKIGPLALLLAVLGGGAALLSGGGEDRV